MIELYDITLCTLCVDDDGNTLVSFDVSDPAVSLLFYLDIRYRCDADQVEFVMVSGFHKVIYDGEKLALTINNAFVNHSTVGVITGHTFRIDQARILPHHLVPELRGLFCKRMESLDV